MSAASCVVMPSIPALSRALYHFEIRQVNRQFQKKVQFTLFMESTFSPEEFAKPPPFPVPRSPFPVTSAYARPRSKSRFGGDSSPDPHFGGYYPTCFCRACRRTRLLPGVGKNTSVPRGVSRATVTPYTRRQLKARWNRQKGREIARSAIDLRASASPRETITTAKSLSCDCRALRSPSKGKCNRIGLMAERLPVRRLDMLTTCLVVLRELSKP